MPSVVGPGGRPITVAQAGGGTIGSDAFYSIGTADGVHLIGVHPWARAGPCIPLAPSPNIRPVQLEFRSELGGQKFLVAFLNVLVPHRNGSLSTFGGIDVYPGNADPYDTT